jgi:transcriptional regulator with XRE-family HTH domain
MAATPESSSVLAHRLEHLFRTVHPKDRGPYTLREVAEGINEAAGEQVISKAYLSQLRNGTRTRVGHDKLVGIAKFFGVDVAYFTDEEVAERTDDQLEVAAAMRDQDVRNLALRAAGLSPRTLKSILDMVENARQIEGLPEESPPHQER